jgi:class 3 adenylate cyclase
MRRLRPLDKVLLGILAPIWIVCFGLSMRSALRGTAFSSVYVSRPESVDDYPGVAGFKPWLKGAASGLQVGDRLLRLGNADLHGVGPLAFYTRVAQEAGREKRLPVLFERGGQRDTTVLPLGSHTIYGPRLAVSAAFALTGIFLLLRSSPQSMARAVFLAMMSVAIELGAVFAGSSVETYASVVAYVFFYTLQGPLAVRAMLLFPHGVGPTSPWAHVGPWSLAVLGPLAASARYGILLAPTVGLPAVYSVLVLWLATMLGIGTRTYQRADAIEQRQIRWVVFGLYCAAVPPAAAAMLAAFDARFVAVWNLTVGAFALCPIACLVAVARYNLFDIDRLISATASYNVLAVLLVGVGLVVVPRAAEGASAMLGTDPSTSQVALSLLLAAVVVPAHHRLRPRIDRILFPERFAIDQGIERLLAQLSSCKSPEALTKQAGEALSELLRPETCVVYGQSQQSYAPLFAKGRAVPPALERESPLIATLRQHHAPLAFGASGRGRKAALLSRFDHAALETLDAAVVVPVRHGDELLALLCLGPKRSGDVYTSTDLTLLGAVADKVSTELLRFDDAEIIRQGRAMQEALRRYVPGAVAKELESGHAVEAGEREVSVLFVDLRGYTALSEDLRPEEIFSTVNSYTDTVSRIVSKHGGSVVEFNGDGMMAVFGAPSELRAKERAAVEAGCEIFGEVMALPCTGPGAGESKLSVGVGVATGEAFVGNIQAVDRMIWTAIGNTTNFAARLQSLTRDLEAAIVIDTPTWEAAYPVAADFQRHEETPIRGRRRTEDVYALPLDMALARVARSSGTHT